MRDVRTLTDAELDQVAAGLYINVGGGGIGGDGGDAVAFQSVKTTTVSKNSNKFAFGGNKSYTSSKVYASNTAVGGAGGSANGGTGTVIVTVS